MVCGVGPSLGSVRSAMAVLIWFVVEATPCIDACFPHPLSFTISPPASSFDLLSFSPSPLPHLTNHPQHQLHPLALGMVGGSAGNGPSIAAVGVVGSAGGVQGQGGPAGGHPGAPPGPAANPSHVPLSALTGAASLSLGVRGDS